MNHDLTIKVRKRNNTIILDLKGALIGSWALDLKEKLLDVQSKGIRNLILNFRDVTSMDSLGVLVIAEALTTGLKIKTLHLPSICIEMFDKHGLFLESYYSENDAIKDLQGGHLEFPERRNFLRKETRIPVEFTTSRGTYRGVILDLSIGGALLSYYDPLPDEDLLCRDIILSIETPSAACITVRGMSVGCREQHLMSAIGVRLIHTSQSLVAVKRLWRDIQPG